MATPAKIIDQNLPTVALVGRVNVGKSSLFNKIIEQRLALVSNIPGTTRTRNVAVASWRGKNFRLIDTGGLTFDSDVPLEDDIIKQTEIALTEADVIVFVVDIQEGLLPQERELAKRLRKLTKCPIILLANKADGLNFFSLAHNKEWRSLGLGAPMPISAATGAQIGDFLDVVYKKLGTAKRRPKKVEAVTPIKVAIMGRPNVGKSSLFNKLIGEDRVIVSAMPHTTREPHDTLVEVDVETSPTPPVSPPARGESANPPRRGGRGGLAHNKQPILFIDTAGIRRKVKVSGELEKIGIGKSIATVSKADIVLLVLDATEPLSDQDQQLGGLLREHTRSVIIVVNKWDEAEDNSDEFRNNVKADILRSFPHLSFAPVVFTSALTGYRTHQIFPIIMQAWQERQTVVDEAALKAFLKSVVKKHLPTRGRGVRHPKLLALTQLGYNPPMFEIMVKANTSVHISYVHFIENQLRKEFGFFASPIIMKLTKNKRFTAAPKI